MIEGKSQINIQCDALKVEEKNKDLVICYHQTKEKYLCHQGLWLESDGWPSVQKFNYTISDSKETSA